MIVQTQTTPFKLSLYQHLLTDNIFIALYDANAQLDYNTAVYTTDSEITGPGYVAGGMQLTGATLSSSGYTVYASFDNPLWTGTNFKCRAALIYNASKGNIAIAVLDFGGDKIASGDFELILPPNDANSALIRSSN
jgi:hypothetical protein